MNNRMGRQFLNAPGPTNVPDEVLNAMHRPAVDLVDEELNETILRCFEDLKKIGKCEDGAAFVYAANGHGAWEASIVNVLSPGDRVLACQSGLFSEIWTELAVRLGVEVESLDTDGRRPVDPAVLEAHLAADTDGEIKAVMAVHVDSSNGLVSDVAGFRRAIDAAGHGALFLVDAVASFATADCPVDDWGIDVLVTASQKGLMQPPGLAATIASTKALEAHERAAMPRAYMDWSSRRGPDYYMWFGGTPPEHLVWGLRKGLDMLFEEGLENTFARHRALAEAVWAAVECWSRAGAVDFYVPDPELRATCVTAVEMDPKYDPAAFRTRVREELNVALAGGYRDLHDRIFRIGHMGYMNVPMLLGTLGAVEIGLANHSVPHEAGGVQAAMNVLSGQLAG